MKHKYQAAQQDSYSRFDLQGRRFKTFASSGKLCLWDTGLNMETVSRAYWIVYYLLYLGFCCILSVWNHGELLGGSDRIQLLAALMGVSAGTSLLIIVVIELGGRVVLLIPARVNSLIDKGRREQLNRTEEAFRKLGIPLTPAVLAYLRRETDTLPSPPQS
jgi:hypothetical protein